MEGQGRSKKEGHDGGRTGEGMTKKGTVEQGMTGNGTVRQRVWKYMEGFFGQVGQLVG